MMHESVKVDSHDTLGVAVEDAMSRAESVFGQLKNTLVDSIEQQNWDSWDKSNENPKVVDTNPASDDDELDGAELTAA
jgi:hypothetical protein